MVVNIYIIVVVAIFFAGLFLGMGYGNDPLGLLKINPHPQIISVHLALFWLTFNISTMGRPRVMMNVSKQLS